MAKNIMEMNDIRNHAHRGGFDLSYKHAFTSKVGELLPCFVKEVLPGDNFTIDVKSFTRTTPVDTAAYTRIREYVDFYFVPYRLLWSSFPSWVVQTQETFLASGIAGSSYNILHSPYITIKDLSAWFHSIWTNNYTDIVGLNTSQQCFKLADLLGYGCFTEPSAAARSLDTSAINLWRFAAYQKIYQDYFRFQQWESASPYCYNFDYVLSDSQTHLVPPVSSSYANNGLFTLRYANWPKDLSMGVLSSPQYGSTAVAGPVLGDLTFTSFGSSGGAPANLHGNSLGTQRTDLVNGSDWVSRLKSSPSNTSGISVFAIRQAEQLQKWSEITASGRQDFKGQLEKHWNIKVPDYASNLCKWLGGTSSNIEISEVVNSNLSGDNVSDIAGKGVGAGSSSRIHFESGSEYGVVMGIYHSVPLLDYNSNLFFDKMLLKCSPADYPIPELDSIGMQEVLAHNIVQQSAADLDSSVYGYAPRYFEYKTSRDIVSGGFAHGGYPSWVASVKTANWLQLFTSKDFRKFKVFPSFLNSIFLAQVDDEIDLTFGNDQLLNNMFFNVTSVRSLSEDGLPY